DDKSRPYGRANPAFTVQYSGFLNGEDAGLLQGQFIGTTAASVNSPIGTYAISGSGQTASNYVISYVDGALTITPYALTVVADSFSRAYGQVNPAFTGTMAGVQNGDNITATFSTSATIGSPVGIYLIIASLSDPDSKLTNYTVFVTNGNLSITP